MTITSHIKNYLIILRCSFLDRRCILCPEVGTCPVIKAIDESQKREKERINQ